MAKTSLFGLLLIIIGVGLTLKGYYVLRTSPHLTQEYLDSLSEDNFIHE